jgi:hypothetical protein
MAHLVSDKIKLIGKELYNWKKDIISISELTHFIWSYAGMGSTTVKEYIILLAQIGYIKICEIGNAYRINKEKIKNELQMRKV